MSKKSIPQPCENNRIDSTGAILVLFILLLIITKTILW